MKKVFILSIYIAIVAIFHSDFRRKDKNCDSRI